ncbi:methyl-accepting chemotaxis protein [Teredinibacter purpureus]|uniref:methyl-accepting chemotaxis protein n=1 Tax=Teredinibacter purpureus TaxID=2731756 RepID=UPI0005F870E8|nr:methyl-accepting chemotaxis protein [Teredinibacter purpureus]
MKTWFMNLTLAQKLISVLLLVGLVPMILVSFIASTVATQQLEQQAFDQLKSVREIKSSAIERYFEQVHSQIVIMAKTPMVSNAAGAFSRSFNRIINSENYGEEELSVFKQNISQYYAQEFAQKYSADNDGAAIDTNALIANLSDTAIVAQARYITENPHPLGEKHLYDGATGRSVYHRVHRKYHDNFRNFIKEFGFYDLFIVDAETGSIVYSVFKELDFGTSLLDGPYAATNFGDSFREALALPEGKSILKDFASYTPSYEAPASFIATPIYYNDKLTSVLIFQMPLEPINTIMGERSGMGKSGESYLVGQDYLMRSDAYLDLKNRSVVASFRHPKEGSVRTEAVERALQGESAERIIRDYNNNAVLSSYSRIDFGDFSWVSIAEIDVSEAFFGVTALKWTMAIIALLGAVIIAAFAFYISKLVSSPILLLGKTIQRVEREGNFQLVIKNDFQDEIGDTSRAFNSLLSNLSSSITGTNIVLEELGKGNYSESVGEHYPGQLGTLTHGVNAATQQVKVANDEQLKQQKIANENAESAEHSAKKAEAQATETLIIKQALDVSATGVMIADADFNIVYMNKSVSELMLDAEADIKTAISSFNPHALMGANIDIFHQNPSHQRSLLAGLKENFKTNLSIGALDFNLSATPIRDNNNTFLGAVVEWENITQELSRQKEERRIADENARIRQALDSSSTSTMIADADYNIIYTNGSLTAMMKNAEPELKAHLGRFNANKLMGENMDVFHKDPSHQRAILSRLTTTYSSNVQAGERSFSLTANPINNHNGERIGTVVEWLDRTNEVAIEHEVNGIINAAAAGDFSKTISMEGKVGFFRNISEGLNRVMMTTNVALDDIIRIFSSLANGDLSQTIDRNYEGEFAKLKEDANITVNKLREVIERISNASANIARGSTEITVGNTDLSQRTEQQASSLEETASSMEEMITIVKQSEENASKASELANRSINIAREGNQSVQATSQAMAEISDSSTKIANIIGVIDEIAFQTNLLALNAAVEAARAGEQGRGFAVVAGEVRNLAQRSAGAAKEIKGLIQDSVSKVTEGSNLVETSGKTLQTIVLEIEHVGTMMEQLLTSAREQTTGIEQVNTAVGQMDQMTQQNAALVEQASATSEAMAEQAHLMDQMVAFFKR